MYKLIFENEHFLIVDKEANVLTVPSRMGRNDSRACLGIQLSKDFKCKILPVHRLDFEVSGIVIFAKNFNAQRDANFWFEKKLIFKTYTAKTTEINPTNYTVGENLVWECLLAKGKKRAYIADFGKKAITHATLISKNEAGEFVWELNPITGRSHQLRFEMYRHDQPIIGDALYNSTKTFEKGIALRAFKIDFSKCPQREKYNLPLEVKIFGF